MTGAVGGLHVASSKISPDYTSSLSKAARPAGCTATGAAERVASFMPSSASTFCDRAACQTVCGPSLAGLWPVLQQGEGILMVDYWVATPGRTRRKISYRQAGAHKAVLSQEHLGKVRQQA